LAGLTPAHLFLVLIIALVVIGPGKLPEVGAAVGKSVREFQKASSGVQESVAGTLTHPAPDVPVQQAQAPMVPVQPSATPTYLDQSTYAVPVHVAPAQPNAAVEEPRSTPQVD
jgi:TatA/E family protein of Tat protein translocase